MATIGVLVPASAGHLNSMNSLGRTLATRGHRVVVAGVLDIRETVLKSGLDVVVLGREQFPVGALSTMHVTLGKLQGWSARRFTLELLARFAKMVLDEAPDVFRALKVDLLLIDQAAPGGTAVAEFLGVPYVTVANALMCNIEPDIPPISTTWLPAQSSWGRARNELAFLAIRRAVAPLIEIVTSRRKAWGLPLNSNPDDWFSPYAEVSQSPAAFEFPRKKLPPHFHFTGPFHDPRARVPAPFPFEALDGRPLIYASMGTLQNRMLWVFRVIAEACDGLATQLVISLGGSADPEVLGPLPGSPVVVRVAPQLELLDLATLAITHAGMNTAMESLARGVPMVAIPVTNDQPGVAARIEWTGAGLVVPPRRLTPRTLREAVTRVLSEPSFRSDAARLKQAIARSGGAERAADVIERVIETGRPVFYESPTRGGDEVAAG